MEKDITFNYNYSAKMNKEVYEIRKKYFPQGENKLDELKRLDGMVQISGMAESLCAGIGGVLIFGLGMCLAMQIIGKGALLIALGVLLGIIGMIGMIGMIVAYPVYRKVFGRTKEKFTPRILELTEELTGEKI